MRLDENALAVSAASSRAGTFSALTRDEHRDLCRAAITAYLQALSPGSTGETEGWRDIESDPPPKDGTHVLLYAPASEYKGEPTAPRLTYGYWLVEEHGAYVGDCGGECRCPEYDDPPEPYWFSEDGGFTKEDPPTHWRPLPAPPSAMLSAAGER